MKESKINAEAPKLTIPRYHDPNIEGIRLVVSDLDGTLLDSHSDLTPEAEEAVHKLREQGIMFTFATGRMDVMTWSFAEKLALDLPIISTNGALLREKLNGTTYFEEPMDDADIVRIFNYGLDREIDILIYTADEVYYFPWSTRISFLQAYNSKASQDGTPLVPLIESRVLPDAGKLWRGRVLKAFIRYSDDQKEDLTAFLNDFTGLEIQQSAYGSVDVNAPGCSKGRAVEFLADALGVPLAQVCTLGDQENDLDMLKVSGLSLAVANALPAVQAAADHIIPAHFENGFAEGIKKHILHD